LYTKRWDLVLPSHRPTRKDIALYYKTHRRQFQIPEQIHVSQIVKNADEIVDRQVARALIEDAAHVLQGGMPFGEAADRYSDCGGNGGELGWVERGVMVEEFEDVVFLLRVGEVSPVFESRFGFHIALVTGKRGPGTLPMSAVYDQIAEFLSAQAEPQRPIRK
jgi:parvulin-like peptidyl-prolyl isomerase